MPPRFPGMDPWLERPALWPGVHASLIAIFRELLAPQIRPRYFADIESRVYLLDEDDPARRIVVPDVTVARDTRQPDRPARTGAVAATPTPASAVLPVVAGELPVREHRVVIRTPDGRTVVAVIELLSPANKTLGSRGRQEYLAKRREVLRSDAHLVEIDLLRVGVRSPSDDRLPRGDYFAHLSRAPDHASSEVWAWTVREAAPTIPIPLTGGDPEAVLDIGAAIRLVYERGSYDVAIDYRRQPEPPLAPDDAAWAASLDSPASRARSG